MENNKYKVGFTHYTFGTRSFSTENDVYTSFNKKVYIYPDGKRQECYANSRVYKLPKKYRLEVIPDGMTDLDILRQVYASKELGTLDAALDEGEKVYRSQRLDNIQRAKARMKQVVMCNTWDYFVTFTFDDKKLDAMDSSLVLKKTQVFLKNLVSRKGAAYMLVPEYHQSGRIHLHALIKGDIDLAFDDVYIVEGYNKPIKVSTIKKRNIPADKIKRKVYNVKGWKYGFSTAIETYGNTARLSNYMLKYMTKDIHKIFGHYYWFSRNLQMYPHVELSNTCDYWRIPSKEYTHGACDVRFKYVNRMGDPIDEDSEYFNDYDVAANL